MDLPPLTRAFVLHVGELSGRWGISRAAGRIFALLFLSSRRLNAEEVSAKLGFSRASVSVSLKELRAWRLVERHYEAGDRREYFAAPGDFRTVLGILDEERRRRELEPTLAMLRAGLRESTGRTERFARARLREMRDLLEGKGTGAGSAERSRPDGVNGFSRRGTGLRRAGEAGSGR